MSKHFWDKVVGIYAATQRKIISTTTYRSDRDSGVEYSTSSKVHWKIVGMPPRDFDIYLAACCKW